MNAAEPDRALPCWCGSAVHQRCWRTATFGLTRCGSCRTYRIDPPPLADERACERFYDEYYRTGERSTVRRRSRLWNVAAREPSLFRVGRSAVDVGCGDGHLCADLAARGWDSVVGLDLSHSRVARARRRYPHLRLLDAPIARAQIPAGSVDLLVLDNVIEHLPDPLATMRELGAYVAPGGQLVVITPNMESGHYRLLGRRWTPELAPHAHIYLFTPGSLDVLLSKAGLRSTAAASFHEPGMGMTAVLSRLVRGNVKGAVWRAGQDAGAAYGRLIGAGPMLYAVTTPARSATDTGAAAAPPIADVAALAGQSR